MSVIYPSFAIGHYLGQSCPPPCGCSSGRRTGSSALQSVAAEPSDERSGQIRLPSRLLWLWVGLSFLLPGVWNTPGAEPEAGTVVYDNTTNYLGQGYGPRSEFGDQVQLATHRPERLLTHIKVRYYLNKTPEDDASIRLRLYKNDGPGGIPGTELTAGQTHRAAVSAGLNQASFDFDWQGPSLIILPDTLTWTVKFEHIEDDDQAMLLMCNPPTVGTSSDTFWIRNDGAWQLIRFEGAAGNFGAQILALPLCLPLITVQPASQTVKVGSNVVFSVEATNCAPFQYQWQKEGAPIAGATQAILTLTNAQSSDAGNYTVAVSNASGSVSSQVATLTVHAPPEIIEPPQSQTVYQGVDVTFNVQVRGTQPFTYQWRKGRVDLAGQTGATLSLNAVRADQAGAYSVSVSNIAGSVTSAEAVLTLRPGPQPPVNPHPANGASGQALNTVLTWEDGGGAAGYDVYFDNQFKGHQTGTQFILEVLRYDTSHAWRVDAVNSEGTTPGRPWGFTTESANPEGLVYNNLTGNLGQGYGPAAEFGDQVQLSTNTVRRRLSQITIEYYYSGTDNPNASLVLKLYRNDGTNGAPGTEITAGKTNQFTLVPGINRGVIDFDLQGAFAIDLPETFTWTARFVGIQTGQIGSLVLYGPPTVGSSGDDFWERNGGGWSLHKLAGFPSNFGLRIIAHPLPFELPFIVSEPEGLVLRVGTNAVFSVRAIGTPSPTYQWQKDGQAIAGATNATLMLPQVQATDAGAYTVLIRNLLGSVTSRPATLSVEVPPQILGSPQAQTVLAGAAATFSVQADGTAPLSYQWQYNGADIPGATRSALTFYNAQPALAGTFTVVVRNAVGSVGSAPAVLVVQVPPRIIEQPQSQTALAGSNVTFSVAAAGTEPLQYQWKLNGADLVGQTKFNLTLTGVLASAAGVYTVVIRNPFGGLTSAPAELVVGPIPAPAPPTNLSPAKGATHQSVNPILSWSNGGGTASYDVYFNGQLKGRQTETLFSPGPLRYASTNDWRVDAVNAVGEVTRGPTNSFTTEAAGPGALVYDNSVTYLEQGRALTDEFGDQVQLAEQTTARLLAGFKIQYYLSDIVDGNEFMRLKLYKDDGTNNYPGTELTDGQTLRLPISPGYNEAEVEFSLQGPLAIRLPESVIWTVRFEGLGPEEQAMLLMYDPPASGSSGDQFWVKTGTGWQLNKFTGSVANFGAQIIANPLPLEAPDIVSQPQDLRLPVGSNAVFTITVTGTAPLSFQWQKDGQPISAATNATLRLENVRAADTGAYSIQISNCIGRVTRPAGTLMVFAPLDFPQITQAPLSQTANLGGNVTFSVSATGTPPLSYQWMKDGLLLSGQIQAFLALRLVQGADAGAYTVLVSNAAGTVASSAATLTIDPRQAVRFLDSGTCLASGGFKLQWTGEQPRLYLEASSNLVTWIELTNTTGTAGAVFFIDPARTNLPSRFYRLRATDD